MSWIQDIRNIRKAFSNINRSACLIANAYEPRDFPKAVGWLRDVQEANLKILREIDRVCGEMEVGYWLSFGTLLGAVRHGGYIPWDDDVDIMMLRPDYEKFIQNFARYASEGYRLKEYYENEWNFTKVHPSFTTSLFVDVFPADLHFEKVPTFQGKKALRELLCKTRLAVKEKLIGSQASDAEKRKWLDGMYSDQVLRGHAVDLSQKPAINLSIDFPIFSAIQSYDYEDVFPLKRIDFEGDSFSCVNRPDRILTYQYGNYMVLPSDMRPHHTEFARQTMESMLPIKDFIGRR